MSRYTTYDRDSYAVRDGDYPTVPYKKAKSSRYSSTVHPSSSVSQGELSRHTSLFRRNDHRNDHRKKMYTYEAGFYVKTDDPSFARRFMNKLFGNRDDGCYDDREDDYYDDDRDDDTYYDDCDDRNFRRMDGLMQERQYYDQQMEEARYKRDGVTGKIKRLMKLILWGREEEEEEEYDDYDDDRHRSGRYRDGRYHYSGGSI